jgi:hypothetical protein
MNLNHRQFDSGNCVSYGDTGVGEGGRVYDDAGEIFTGGILQPVNDLTLMVTLAGFRFKVKLFGLSADFSVYILKALRSVNFRFPPAEKIKVGAVNYKYFHGVLFLKSIVS